MRKFALLDNFTIVANLRKRGPAAPPTRHVLKYPGASLSIQLTPVLPAYTRARELRPIEPRDRYSAGRGVTVLLPMPRGYGQWQRRLPFDLHLAHVVAHKQMLPGHAHPKVVQRLSCPHGQIPLRQALE